LVPDRVNEEVLPDIDDGFVEIFRMGRRSQAMNNA